MYFFKKLTGRAGQQIDKDQMDFESRSFMARHEVLLALDYITGEFLPLKKPEKKEGITRWSMSITV